MLPLVGQPPWARPFASRAPPVKHHQYTVIENTHGWVISKYRDFGLSYLRGGKYSGVIGHNGDQGIIDAQLMENPVDQLHRYVQILLGGQIEEPFRILGLRRRDVYILYGPAQFLRQNRKMRYLTMGVWIG